MPSAPPPPNRVIAACAGSGKTHALIQRLLALLQSGAAPGEIVAITFTKKAAAEIRARLFAALRQKADAGEGWAEQCLRRIMLAKAPGDALAVHTFHSWFMLLLDGRNWSPGWFGPAQLLESDEALREAAWRRWLVKTKDHPLLPTALRHCSPTMLKELLFKEFVGKINIWRLYDEKANPMPAPDPAPLRRELALAVERFVAAVGEAGGRLLQKARAAAETFLADDDIAGLEKPFFTKQGKLDKRLAKDAEKNDRALALDDIVAAHGAWLAAAQIAETAEFNDALITLGRLFLRECDSAKNDAHVMTFDDLEYDADRAAAAEGDVNALLFRLHRRFRHILIDEFQDCSPLQWRIVRRWLEAAHGGEDAPSVFIVGDEKQAIYRFRNGDSRLLAAAADFLRDYYLAEKEVNDVCRRCSPSVLELVNAVFEGRMDGYVRHRPAAGVNDELPGRVEWHPPLPAPLPAPPRRNPRNPLKEPAAEGETPRRRWAAAVAARLGEIIGKALIDDNGEKRLCRAEDVLILVPQSTHVGELSAALSARGISCALRGGGASFLRAVVCRDMLALAKALLSPKTNSLSLAQALKSPLFSFSEDLLADIAVGPGGGLWARLMRDRRRRTLRARECLWRWRGWARSGVLPAHDLLSKIVADGDVFARYCAAVAPPFRPQTVADLSAFLDFSLANDGGRKPLLRQFVAAARAALDSANPPPPPLPSAGARLMTTHGAKGLEAPVVVIADSAFGRQYAGDKSAAIDLLTDWPPEAESPARCAFRLRVLAAAHADLARQEESFREREYENLLYVALTRARQMLLIFSTGKGESAQEAALFAAVRRVATEQKDGVWALGEDLPSAAAAALAPLPAETPQPRQRIGYRRSPAARRGEELHRLVALLLEGLTDDEALAIAAPTYPETLATAKRLLATPPLRELLENSQERHIEAEFVDGDSLYRLDLLLVDKNGDFWVIDHKSGGRPSRYRRQMERYRRVVMRAHPGKTVRAAIVTAAGEFHCLDFD